MHSFLIWKSGIQGILGILFSNMYMESLMSNYHNIEYIYEYIYIYMRGWDQQSAIWTKMS